MHCMKPRVSIITSIYKASDFLYDFLIDVKRQFIFPESEVLLLDANPEGYEQDYEIIKPFLNLHPFKYSKIGECNVYEAWNKGIELSSSDIIANWNVDDRRSVTSLKNQVCFLENNPDSDVCYGHVKVTSEPNEVFEYSNSTKMWPCLDGSIKNQMICNSPHCLPVWKKSIHARFGLFDTSYFSSADYDMWFRVLTGGGKLSKIDDTFGLYYANPNSISRKKETLGKAQSEVIEIRLKYS